MEILGYSLAVLIGVSLGLIGSGGSILTVPLLVYFFGLPATLATAYSLFIVGISAATGAIRFVRKKEVDLKTAALFAIPSLIAVYAVRRFLMPALPEVLFTVGSITVTKNAFILVFFALIMLWAGLKMVLPKKKLTPAATKKHSLPLIVAEGLVVGSLTGFVGAGGGFLIIPALVLWVGLPMKKAVATSLLIIAVKSLLGFIGDIQTQTLDWALLIGLAAAASAGIFLGMYWGQKVDGTKLRKGFGWFVVLMAVFMLLKETLPSLQ